MDPATSGDRRLSYERLFERILGRRIGQPQNWKQYVLSMLVFNVVMYTLTYLVFILQGYLPLNPDGKVGLEASLAFNTAASFTSNTNLQHYSGEQSLSYFTQIFAIMWPQFVSAATGIAAVTALCRGLSGRKELGNFYQ